MRDAGNSGFNRWYEIDETSLSDTLPKISEFTSGITGVDLQNGRNVPTDVNSVVQLGGTVRVDASGVGSGVAHDLIVADSITGNCDLTVENLGNNRDAAFSLTGAVLSTEITENGSGNVTVNDQR